MTAATGTMLRAHPGDPPLEEHLPACAGARPACAAARCDLLDGAR